jgi:type VI secretion system protein VasD
MQAAARDPLARRTTTRLPLLLAVAAITALGACKSAPPPPKPTTVSALVQASAGANPDAHMRPSPLVVRLFELKSTAAFDTADFVSLYDRDQATLAAEMAGREEFTLRPGEKRTWEKPLEPDVRFIGAIAAYRDIEHARWKALVAVKPNKRNVVTIQADDLALAATVVAQ